MLGGRSNAGSTPARQRLQGSGRAALRWSWLTTSHILARGLPGVRTPRRFRLSDSDEHGDPWWYRTLYASNLPNWRAERVQLDHAFQRLAKQFHHALRHAREPLSGWHSRSDRLLAWALDQSRSGSGLVQSRPQAPVLLGIQPAPSASTKGLALRSRLFAQQDRSYLQLLCLGIDWRPQSESSQLLPLAAVAGAAV